MTYYYIYILVALFCIVREHQNLCEEQRRWNLKLAVFPIFLLMALKGQNVGSDTTNYTYMYEIFTDSLYMNEYSGIEPGYNLLQKLLFYISPNPQLLMAAVAIITSVSVYFFFRDFSKYSCTALFFFMAAGFLPFALSGLRQTIAISICLFSFRFVKQKKLWYFLTIVAFAMTFHKSAAFFIPAYFIANIDLKSKNITYMFLGILLTFFFADRVFSFAADTLSYDYGLEETGNGFIFFFIVLLISYFGLKFRYKIYATCDSNYQITNINFLSLVMWTLRLVSRTAERVSLYFLPFTAILLEETIETASKENRTIIRLACLFIAIYLFLHRVGGQEYLSNYKLFFQ